MQRAQALECKQPAWIILYAPLLKVFLLATGLKIIGEFFLEKKDGGHFCGARLSGFSGHITRLR
jgi:hypothetical protein